MSLAYQPGEVRKLREASEQSYYALLGKPNAKWIGLYLHGFCGDIHAFGAFRRSAVEVGSLVALRGDIPCPKRRPRARWSQNLRSIRRRFLAAAKRLQAIRGERGKPLHTFVVGYSQGASRGESLAALDPAHFGRAILLAGPKAPNPGKLAKAEGVAIIAPSLDRKKHLRLGAQDLQRLGIRARYFEMPKARHGQYGPAGNEVMGQALTFILQASTHK